MRRIMASQLYQLKRIRAMWMLIIGITLIFLLTVIGPLLNLERPTASLLIGQQMPLLFVILTIMTGVVSAFLCTNDFTDQTLNHEVLSGVSRMQSYFGRAIPAILVSVVLSLFWLAMAVCAADALYGWGNQLSVQTVAAEILLTAFPLIRLSCFFVMLSFIIKRPFIVIGISCAMIYLIFQVGGSTLFNAHNYYLAGIANAFYILNTEQFGVFAAGSEHINYVLVPTVTPASAAVTVAVSLVFSAGWLLLGYSYFHHDDLK